MVYLQYLDTTICSKKWPISSLRFPQVLCGGMALGMAPRNRGRLGKPGLSFPPTRLANGLHFGRLYEKKWSGPAHAKE